MRGLIFLGEEVVFEDLLRDLAALAIAYVLDRKVNVLINGEIELPNIKSYRFDHVATSATLPIDLTKIVTTTSPRVIIEDSVLKKRLYNRMSELKSIDVPVAYLLVNRKPSNNVVFSLKKTDTSNLYVLEVGV
ncbi:hypothetical protein [Infirmifilum sp.]|uniref:hypothetical protein n=1 Tax=Infirmifilum sp. TaxID=2856575 RepID=UPI003D0973E0